MIKNIKNKANFQMLMFVLPALTVLGIFVMYNTIVGFYYSLTSWDGLSLEKNYIGFRNYITAFKDEYFLRSLTFTVKYTIFNVILTNFFGLMLAVFLNAKIKAAGVLKTIFFIPNVIAIIVSAFIWTFVFNSVFESIYESTGFYIFGLDWFGTPDLAFIMIMITSVWIKSGYMMIIYLTGLKNIDNTLIEAANIDGAGAFKMFIKIKLPLIVPSIVAGIFMMTITSFKSFDLIFTFTNGGPYGTTQTIALNIYKDAFTGYQAGLASAKSVILFFIIMIITYLEVYFLKKREVEM